MDARSCRSRRGELPLRRPRHPIVASALGSAGRGLSLEAHDKLDEPFASGSRTGIRHSREPPRRRDPLITAVDRKRQRKSVRLGRLGQPRTDDLGSRDRDPLVDGDGSALPSPGYVCGSEGLADGAQPLDCTMARRALGRALHDGVARVPERLEANDRLGFAIAHVLRRPAGGCAGARRRMRGRPPRRPGAHRCHRRPRCARSSSWILRRCFEAGRQGPD